MLFLDINEILINYCDIVDLNKNLIYKKKDISIVINLQNLTVTKHNLFYEVMTKLNSTWNYYFIKSENNFLDPNINELVSNSSVKIVQSNFPDSIYLPLVISLYGNTIPGIVLFIEGEEIPWKLCKWFIKMDW